MNEKTVRIHLKAQGKSIDLPEFFKNENGFEWNTMNRVERALSEFHTLMIHQDKKHICIPWYNIFYVEMIENG